MTELTLECSTYRSRFPEWILVPWEHQTGKIRLYEDIGQFRGMAKATLRQLTQGGVFSLIKRDSHGTKVVCGADVEPLSNHQPPRGLTRRPGRCLELPALNKLFPRFGRDDFAGDVAAKQLEWRTWRRVHLWYMTKSASKHVE